MLSLTFLGTGAACPTVDRNVSSVAVHREGEMLLFDCGEGTQRQMMRYGVGFSFKDIFFTHYHADHFLGVIGLCRTMGLMDRKEGVTLYGPKGAQRILSAALGIGIERTKFPVEIIEVKPGDRLGRVDPERSRELGIPEGPLWGEIHKWKTVSLPDGRTVTPAELVGPPRPARRVVFSGDTRPHPAVLAAARGADLLVHEATFGQEERGRALETGHSTAREAAIIAREAGALRLVLTHVSARYSREAPELLAEAQEIFPETMVARDGLTVEVPFRS